MSEGGRLSPRPSVDSAVSEEETEKRTWWERGGESDGEDRLETFSQSSFSPFLTIFFLSLFLSLSLSLFSYFQHSFPTGSFT